MDPKSYALEEPWTDAPDLYRRVGFVVLRQVLEPAAVHATRRRVQCAFEDLDERKATLDDADRRLLDRLEMPVPREGDQFRLRSDTYRVLDSDHLRKAIQACVGDDFLWHFPPMLRRQSHGVAGAALPYHQDSTYTRHYPRFLVCWTPLTPCGIDAPGLELVAGEHETELDHHQSDLWEHGIDQGLALDFASRGIAPELSPGDVILFSSRTPHRTYLTSTMTRARLTIDFRAVAAHDLDSKTRSERRFVNPTDFELG